MGDSIPGDDACTGPTPRLAQAGRGDRSTRCNMGNDGNLRTHHGIQPDPHPQLPRGGAERTRGSDPVAMGSAKATGATEEAPSGSTNESASVSGSSLTRSGKRAPGRA